MGVDYLKVVFINPKRVYSSGDEITAHVAFSVNSVIKINKIVCQVQGKSTTYWQEQSGSTTYSYRGEESYFEKTITLLEKKNCVLELHPGAYKYELTFELPDNIPPTYVGKKGKIEYSITAILDRPWKFNKCVEELFVVKQVLDLNKLALINPNIKEPAFLQLNESFCCCFNHGEITANIEFPYTGFARGQIVPFTVKIENASNVRLRNMNYHLYKSTVFYTTCRGYKKKKQETLLSGSLGVAVPCKSSRDISCNLHLPNIPFENMDNCSIIDIDYILRFELEVSATFSFTLPKDLPVTFGTVHLENFYTIELPSPPSYEESLAS